MHIALFSRCTTESDLKTLAEAVSRWPDLVAVVALSGDVVDSLADHPSRQLIADSRIEWARSIRTAPSLAHLPGQFLRTALAAEHDALDALGLSGSTVYFEGLPTERLPRLAREADMTALVTTTPEPRSGVLVHLDMVIACFGAAEDHQPPGPGDGLTVWHTPIEEMESTVEAVLQMPGCDLTTPPQFLSQHRAGGAFDTTGLGSNPNRLLARKLVRLSTRLPRRPSTDVTNLVLEAASIDGLDQDAGGQRHRRAHEALIQARAKIDASRRRNDDWAKVSRLDWNANGSEEIQVELATTSFVVDPSKGAKVLVLDDKVSGSAVGWIADERLGVIARRALDEGDESRLELEVTGVDERRDGVSIGMESADRDVLVAVTVGDRSLEIEYAFTEVEPARFGPELPLAVGSVDVRVDGGEWVSLHDTMAVTGHRFRLRSDSRQVLISTLLPTDLFIRPSGDEGVVIWPNWLVSGTAAYSVKVDLNP